MIPGGRSPVSGFASRGRKRGTCTRGAGVGPRAEGQRSPAAGQAAVAVAPGRGQRGCHRRGDGERLADRGPRAAAGGGHKKECPAPCSGPTAAALPYSTPLDLRLGLFPGRRSRLGAWAWAQRGGGSPRRGGSGDGAGAGAGGPASGATAGRQGWAAREEQAKVEVHLRLVPGGRIRGPGRATPMMVTTTGRSVRSFPQEPGPGGWAMGAGCRAGRRRRRVGSDRRPGGAPGVSP